MAGPRERAGPAEGSPQSVTRLPHGGFKLEGRGAAATRVVPAGDGWRIEGDPEMQDWTMRRAESGSGFVLREGPRELGRTMSAIGMSEATAPRHLLLGDGRLFRIIGAGRREAGADLTSWETRGPYLRARPATEGWTIAPSAACGGIADIRALTLLLAAEMLDGEEPLRPPASR